MNFFSKIKGLKLIALLAVMATSLMAAAENKVYIEPFSISSYEPVEVPVYMDNDEDIYGVQWRIDLPAELEIVENSAVMDQVRCSNGQRLSFKGVGMIISSWQGKPIVGNSGAVLTFKVRVKDGMLSSKSVDLGLSRIRMSDSNNKAIAVPDQTTVISLVGEENTYVFSTTAQEVAVTAGSTFPLEVSMNNNVPLGGMQFDMSVPAGFDVDATNIKFSNRMTGGSMLNKTVRPDGSLRFTLIDLDNTRIAEPGDGVIFTMDVIVPETFEAYDGMIQFSNVIASTVPNGIGMTIAVPCNNFEVKVINGGKYLSDAEAVVEGLRNSLTEALATIAETCPNVKDNFTGEEISTSIDAIEAAAREASANGTLHTSYNAVVIQPAAAVSTAITKLIDDAKSAQAVWEADRTSANEAAYNAAMEIINGLQSKLDAMKSNVAETYPGFDASTLVAAAQEAIDNAKTAAEEEKKAVATEGNYNYTPDKETIEALIVEIGKAAESYRAETNQAAYDATFAELEALQNALNEMIAKVGEKYPEIDVTNEIAAAQNAITEAKAEAVATLEDVKDAGFYSYTVNAEAINALIAAIETAAADGAEAKRVADNQAAYEACMEELATLQIQLNEAKARAAENYPASDVTAQVTAAQEAIDNAKAAVEAEKTRVATEGTFGYQVDKTNIETLIAAIETAAAAAEADRVAANQAAYQASMKELEALQKSLDEMIAKVGETYPGFDVNAEISAAQNAITEAQTEAGAALEAVAITGTYSYTVDSEGINALITAIETAAKVAADDAEAKRVADNKAAYEACMEEIATLQAKLDEMKSKVAETYPGFDVTAEITAAQTAIDNEKAAVEAEKDRVAAEGNFSYEVDKDNIEALIAAIETAAKAAADKAEADRVAANEAAYQVALKAIEALQTKLDNMKTLVGVTYPKVDVSKEISAAQEAIDKAKADADAAFEAVAKEGNFDYTVDSKFIEELIDAIRKAAVDGQAAIDAEAARVAANQAAYQDVLSEIAALQSKLDNMKTLVTVSYPGAEVTEEVKAAQDAIDKAKADALAALEAVADEGTFEYTVDKAGIEALIDEILAAAKVTGIYEIEMEVEEGVKYFNLQGARVLHPTKGMLLIRVTNDGKREKVIL